MTLVPWRVTTRDRDVPSDRPTVPEVPEDGQFDAPQSATASGSPRARCAERDQVSAGNLVTRRMAGAVHARVDRIGQARDWLGRWGDRLQGREPRLIRTLDPNTGDNLARWVLDNVLCAQKRPVPSFGFSLIPVLVHSAAARRRWRLRAAALVSAFVGLSVLRPWGLTAVIVAALLFQFTWGPRGRAVLRWAFSSVVSTVLLVAAVLGLWTAVRPHLPLIVEAMRDGSRLALELLVAATVVGLLDRWAALARLRSLRPGCEGMGCSPRLAPFTARRVRECAVTEMWQTIAYRAERRTDHFVGGGVDAWRRGATRVQLAPAGADGEENGNEWTATEADDPLSNEVRKFEADELLDAVRQELEYLKGKLVRTHTLPNCDVAEFLAVPQNRWSGLPYRAVDTWPEITEMLTEARQPPTGHFSRRYLAAQVVSWDGQIVVTVFAHAALEGNTLHFVTRPHILAPLSPWANLQPAAGQRLVTEIAKAPLHACGDTIALAVRLYGYLGRGLRLLAPVALAAAMSPQKDDGLPISLREHCGLEETEDMHQTEDVQRYVSILQSRMFQTVTDFLADHGYETAEFRRQVVSFTQNFISGDNNQVNTGSLGGGMNQQGGAPAEPQ
ncbi:hypothetical protein [Streptomyces sp. SBT349]|uniref:hypothetical protein n=1 Tax=Streptomyces sp. SBT349 TaxID=1580539 RepID=UPI000AB04C93|nr:hypothetical protein [Streptomyces sp. SBT349]